MDLDTIRWLVTVAAMGGGFWFLMQYRMNQNEKAIDLAKVTSEAAISKAKVESDLAIAKAREEVRKELDTCWTAVHQGERNHAKHVEESYNERLKISERFTEVLLVQNTTAGEVKNILKGIDRLETNFKELADEVKKS